MPKIKQPINVRDNNSLSNQDEDKQVEVPDMVQRHAALKAEIEAKKKEIHTVGNPLNVVDNKINEMRKNDKEWDMKKPYRLEEFGSGMSPYRGQGLLPSDKTRGVNVIDRADVPHSDAIKHTAKDGE